MKIRPHELCALAGAAVCLLGANWAQQRGNERRTGASTEPLPPPVALRWSVDLGAEVVGEPVVDGCTIAVTTTDGRTLAFNSRSGQLLWQDTPSWMGAPPVDARSSLAFSGSVLFAGIPVDPAIPRLWAAMDQLSIGCDAYAVDNNLYPPGPDLEADLVPTYVQVMPLNPATGLVMVESETPSPGDYRYRAVGGSSREVGMWWNDGGMLAMTSGTTFGCAFTPPPDWPTSPVAGGNPSILDSGNGSVIFRDTAGPALLGAEPLPVPGGVVWTTRELRTSASDSGRIRATDSAGTTVWERILDVPAIFGAARDAVSGWLFAATGAGNSATSIAAQVRMIATSCEAYAVDNNLYPPSGEIADDVTPTYTKCLPANLYERRTMHYSELPSAGDYYYEADGGQDYRIWLWNSTGQPIAHFADGAFVDPPVDSPPEVVAVDATGNPAWRTAVAAVTETITAPILASGMVAVGTSAGEVVLLDAVTGAEIGRRAAGGSFSLPPTLDADGNLTFVNEGGEQCRFAPPLFWSFYCWPNGGYTSVPITATSDGLLMAKTDGRLRGTRSSTPYSVWDVPLGGVAMSPLVTAPVLSNGWVYVVRGDGRLLAVADAATGGAPPDPGGSLRASAGSFGSVVLSWTGVASSGAPGEHLHLERRSTPGGAGTQLLPHPSSPTGFVDGSPPADAFWVLRAADCGENGSP